MYTAGFIGRMRLGGRKWREGADVGDSSGDAVAKRQSYGF